MILGGHRTTLTVPTAVIVPPILTTDLSATSDATLPVAVSAMTHQGVLTQSRLDNSLVSSIGDPPATPLMDEAVTSEILSPLIEDVRETDFDSKYFL